MSDAERSLGLATRQSPLALAQAAIVSQTLAAVGVGSRIVPIVTTGDRDRHSSVSTLTEVGAFVRSVQAAVLDGRADVAVHSGKDLPVDGPPGLIGFHLERGSPWDVLCGARPDTLPEGAVVGTGSPRRSAQIRLLCPGVDVTGIRGNVETRLGKVGSSDVAAVVLAEAGLARLGLGHVIDHRFTLAEMVPAPAQGVLTIEAAAGSETASVLADLEHADTKRAIVTERGLLAAIGAGCRSALGALAHVAPDGSIRLDGFVDDDLGPRRGSVVGDDPKAAVAALTNELRL